MALGLQPISSNAVHAGRARSTGNALGLQSVNQTWLVLDVGWQFTEDDDIAHDATRRLNDQVIQASQNHGEDLEYIFMNDASWDQNVIGHFGAESVEKMKTAQKKYDPDSVFQRLVPGGFKIPEN